MRQRAVGAALERAPVEQKRLLTCRHHEIAGVRDDCRIGDVVSEVEVLCPSRRMSQIEHRQFATHPIDHISAPVIGAAELASSPDRAYCRNAVLHDVDTTRTARAGLHREYV
jgi:hypothetical protein